MNNDNLDYIYGTDTIDIHEEVFDKDFDDAGFEPEVIDDSNAEAALEFGY